MKDYEVAFNEAYRAARDKLKAAYRDSSCHYPEGTEAREAALNEYYTTIEKAARAYRRARRQGGR